MTTINTRFNASDLPTWAQNDSVIVERCRNDLAFRADVCNAETAQRRNQLRRDAYRLREQIENQ